MTVITAEKHEKKQATAPETATAVRGIADISGGRGFIRTSGYLRSGGDIPLTANQVRQFGLRNGDLVEGAGNGKTLSSVESVSGIPAEQARQRRHFDDLTPSTRTSGSASKTATPPPPHGSSTWSPPSVRASAVLSWPRLKRARQWSSKQSPVPSPTAIPTSTS